MNNYEALGWITVVNLALFFRTLRHKFVSDDFSVWKNPPEFKNGWHKAWLRFTGAGKWLSRTPYFFIQKGRLKMSVLKTEEFEHFIAILMHLAIGFAIYFAFGRNWVAFIAALLYTTNPANNQGTIWPGGRGYALSILSLLLSIIIPFLAPALLYFCSWYPAGFFAPLALIGGPHWMLLGWMPLIWILQKKKYSTAIKQKSTNESFDEDKIIHPKKLILLFKTYGFYFLLCIFPFRITFYHNFLQSMSGNAIMKKKAYKFDRYFFTGIAAASFTFWLVWKHPGNLSWALLAFMLPLLPFCNFRRANQEIAERFAALPNVFLMYALAQVIAFSPVVVTAFLIFYATRNYYTLIMYKDEYYITEVAIIEDPHAWWAWHCRAMKRWETQSYKEALILWVMANLISPKEFKILMNIATCLRLLKNNTEAEEYLKRAEENIVAGQEEESLAFIANHRAGKLPILL